MPGIRCAKGLLDSWEMEGYGLCVADMSWHDVRPDVDR